VSDVNDESWKYFELVAYEWDERTGLASFSYENPDTGEIVERTQYQTRYWTKKENSYE
jgi:hypothetical protein